MKKIIMFFMMLLALVSTVSATSLTDGLISYYTFDSDASDLVSSNDGVVHNATHVSSKFGNAYDFDGVNDYIEIADNLYAPEMTFSVWVNFDKVSGRQCIFSKRTGYIGQDTFQLELPADYNKFHFLTFESDDTYRKLEAFTLPTANTWHHLVGIHSTSGSKLYMDGNLIGSIGTSKGLKDYSLSTLIGRALWQGGIYYYLDGTVDEFSVWGRALSENEVLALYKNKTGLLYPFPGINESEARLIIDDTINTELSNPTIYTDQKVYLRYNDGTQKYVTFDKLAVKGNQYWGFNYITDGEANVTIDDMGNTFHVWQGSDLLGFEVESEVSDLISSTVV